MEHVSFEARESDFVDKKSGVSARLTISALENLYSTVERRLLLNAENTGTARISDIYGILPSITGKVELVYEGEVEGIANVANTFIGKAIRKMFLQQFPDPDKIKKAKGKIPNVYAEIIDWFNDGNSLDVLQQAKQSEYEKALQQVKGLKELVKEYFPKADKQQFFLMMEFALHGLAECSQLSKSRLENGIQFKDIMGSVFNLSDFESDN